MLGTVLECSIYTGSRCMPQHLSSHGLERPSPNLHPSSRLSRYIVHCKLCPIQRLACHPLPAPLALLCRLCHLHLCAPVDLFSSPEGSVMQAQPWMFTVCYTPAFLLVVLLSARHGGRFRCVFPQAAYQVLLPAPRFMLLGAVSCLACPELEPHRHSFHS